MLSPLAVAKIQQKTEKMSVFRFFKTIYDCVMVFCTLLDGLITLASLQWF